jgi:hypothetical protein
MSENGEVADVGVETEAEAAIEVRDGDEAEWWPSKCVVIGCRVSGAGTGTFIVVQPFLLSYATYSFISVTHVRGSPQNSAGTLSTDEGVT